MTTVKGLQRVLRKRLPTIDRWRRVTVYLWDSPRLPWFIKPEKDTFIIYWSGPKRKNIHPDEYKEVPLKDLELITERNRMRLRNKTKQYK